MHPPLTTVACIRPTNTSGGTAAAAPAAAPDAKQCLVVCEGIVSMILPIRFKVRCRLWVRPSVWLMLMLGFLGGGGRRHGQSATVITN